MRVAILTLGSRGDVQPYVAIGKGLVKAGHQVIICTGRTFENFIVSNGLEFRAANADFMEFVLTEEGRALMNGKKIAMKKMMKFVKEVINPAFRKSFDDFLAAAQGADVIIYHPKASIGEDIAQYLGIPSISMPPVPMIYPTREFPNLAVAPDKDFGAFLNKLTYMTVKFSEVSSIKLINEFRETELGFKRRKSGAYKPLNLLYPISRHLFRDVTSWNGHVELTGFPYLDIENAKLDSRVVDFINAGDRPWVISFSSMPAEGMDHIIEEVITERNERAIFISGNSSMQFNSKNILCIERAPHQLVFKEARGIVHHGGVGTTAEALRSGRPQHIIPFSVDQPFWANRLWKMGLMQKPFRARKFTKDLFINALESMESGAQLGNAKEIAKVIESEDGIGNAVRYIERVVYESRGV